MGGGRWGGGARVSRLGGGGLELVIFFTQRIQI